MNFDEFINKEFNKFVFMLLGIYVLRFNFQGIIEFQYKSFIIKF